ncbi:type II secretion system minor pseudopilin GspH [Halomonadaceae bacterium KBTZ08]
MTRRHQSAGFTLIELMVVLVIVGLLLSLIGLNIGGGGERRELREVARSLYLRMQAASEEAVMTNREIGIRFQKDGYEFLQLDREQAQWAPVPRGGLSGASLPAWVELELMTDGGEADALETGDDDKQQPEPDLVFFSSGESTAFDLYLWWEKTDGNKAQLLTSDGATGVEWLQPGDEDYKERL